MNISIDFPSTIFDIHLKKKENKHVLFSAAFGTGKTYFLDKYFKSSDSYKAFFLSPVKYVVGQNEDIFEYIKIDIAMQLLQEDAIVKEVPFKANLDQYLYQYLINKPYEVAELLFESIKESEIPKVKEGVELLLKGLKSRDKFLLWKEDFDKKTEASFDKFHGYLSHQTSIKG